MHIDSMLLCRASGKVYEKLAISNTPEGGTISPCYSDEEGIVPCRLFKMGPTNSGSTQYILVYPIVDIPTARYILEEYSNEGRRVSTLTREDSFDSIKWRSRLNYRIHSDACAEIRNWDDSHFDNCSSVSVTQIIPDNEWMIVRGSYQTPYVGNHHVRMLCRSSSLSSIEARFIDMGSSNIPSRISDYITFWQCNFSVRLPRSLADFFLICWDENNHNTNAYIQISSHQRDQLLHESSLTFMSAGLDPYYGEWLRLKRPTMDELELEKTSSLPSMPKFSFVVPLYQTPEHLFDSMVASVREQSYIDWELILINASPEVESLSERVRHAEESDPRIKAVFLERNYGISENTRRGISCATGDFVCFLDHDDLIEPDTLFEYAKAINEHPDADLIYCDEDILDLDGKYKAPFFKPDFDIDLLRTKNYITHMLTVRLSLLTKLEIGAPEYDGAQDHHITLQAAERARYICHIPKVLYHWRVCETSSAGNPENKAYAADAGLRAVSAHLKRVGISAKVLKGKYPFSYRVLYDVPEEHPLVSVIIPTSDHINILKTCIDSILGKTTYDRYEIILVENNSKEAATFEYYETLYRLVPDKVRVERWGGEFNYSKIVNFGVSKARGDYLLLLNNDTELITPEWMERLVGICSRGDIGAAGALLYYPDDTIQHAGVVVTAETGNHLFKNMPRGNDGYFNLVDCQRQLSAVTAACLMTTRKAFELVGGFEESLTVCYNDVDYCLKLRDLGYAVVYTPEVQMYHYESLSRGLDEHGDKHVREIGEHALLFSRWHEFYALGDPFFTPNVRQEYPLNSWYRF